LAQIENSIAKEPKIQPTGPNQRSPSGNQEICSFVAYPSSGPSNSHDAISGEQIATP
jgi:hypothetical protein